MPPRDCVRGYRFVVIGYGFVEATIHDKLVPRSCRRLAFRGAKFCDIVGCPEEVVH